MDKAQLNISAENQDNNIGIYAQSEECLECPLWFYEVIPARRNSSLDVNTTFATVIQIVNNTGSEICKFNYHFGEQGKYFLNINENKCDDVRVVQQPINSNFAILWATMFLFGAAFLWTAGKIVWRRRFREEAEDERLLIRDLGSPDNAASLDLGRYFTIPSNSKKRLGSLDTFRGFCIAIMIFVNYGGGGFWFFKHSTWNGLTVADLVFPWFLWIMGTSLALSMKTQLRRSIPRKWILWKIVKRSLILFLLGLLLNQLHLKQKSELKDLRILGVLQRFSICYLVVAGLHLIFEKPTDVHQLKWWAPVRDILVHWSEWLIMLAILTLHTLIIFLIPVPGCPKGYFGPGGLHMNKQYFNCTGGATGYIDRFLLTDSHMYQNPTCKKIYSTSVPFDPEGLVASLPSIFIVFLGLQAGKILIYYRQPQARIKRLVIWGIVLGAIASVLCFASKEDGWIPVNKNLWSMSYTLATASMGYILFSICYFIVDLQQYWTGVPFIYSGMNSIILYVGHEITKGMFPFSFGNVQTHSMLLYSHLWGTALWIVISALLFYKQFFISL